MVRRKSSSKALLLALVFIITGLAIPGALKVHAASSTNVSINAKNLVMKKGQTKQLRITGTKSKITWRSSKPSVAAVNTNGKVTAKKAGTAVITGRVSKKNYTCRVRVRKSETKASDTKTTRISITIGDTVLYGQLNNSDLAKEFAGILPQTISMQRVGGGREFYGSLRGSLNYDIADSQTTFENGEIAYWYSGNGLCLLYDNQVEKPEIDSGVIILGKITSDFSVLHDLGDDIRVTVDIAE